MTERERESGGERERKKERERDRKKESDDKKRRLLNGMSVFGG